MSVLQLGLPKERVEKSTVEMFAKNNVIKGL